MPSIPLRREREGAWWKTAECVRRQAGSSLVQQKLPGAQDQEHTHTRTRAHTHAHAPPLPGGALRGCGGGISDVNSVTLEANMARLPRTRAKPLHAKQGSHTVSFTADYLHLPHPHPPPGHLGK